KPRVFLRKVRIEIPVGEGESDLTTVGGAQAIRPSAAGGGPGGWAGQGTGTPSGKALFDFGPNNAADVDPFTGFGLVLTLPNVEINDVASTTPLQIKVTVYTSPLATTPETSWTASTDIPSGVHKFPENFVFSGLRVEEVMIPYNTSGTLRWESQAANCTVVYKPIGGGNDVRIDVGAEKEWPTPRLTTYTNFRVEARSIQTENTTIYALNATALVDTPDLTLRSLRVNVVSELHGYTQTEDLTCVSGYSIRTKYLRGPSLGDRELIIDEDGKGVAIRGNTKFTKDAEFDGHISQAQNKILRTENIRPVADPGKVRALIIGSSDSSESNNVVVIHHQTGVRGKLTAHSLGVTGNLTADSLEAVDIRTKHLGGPSAGDQTLIIDQGGKGTDFAGPVKLLSSITKRSLPTDWQVQLSYDRLYFGNSENQKFYIDIALPGGGELKTIQVDAWRSYSFVVPAGGQYRRREGSEIANAYSVNFGRL
ncbi:hypothetical protein ACWCZ5_34965, partial [Streptomyces sp. NPDC001667]